jgi:L-cystine uptake protein TcyP (sodium:dicarboxylate symporter family)
VIILIISCLVFLLVDKDSAKLKDKIVFSSTMGVLFGVVIYTIFRAAKGYL